jgi:ADP-ribose pyrophosphatase YjhB (NUDIX family)
METIVHVSVLVTHDERVAMVREAAPGCCGLWNLPGGHLEHDEGLAEGASRELREETGVEVPLAGLLGVYTGHGRHHLINFVFTATTASGDLRCPDPDVSEARWFSVAELIGLPAESVLNPRKLRRILEDYESREPYALECIGESLYGPQLPSQQLAASVQAQEVP